MIKNVRHGGFQGGYVPLDNPLVLQLTQYTRIEGAVYARGVLRRRPGTSRLGGGISKYVVRLYGALSKNAYYLIACAPDDVFFYDASADAWSSFRGAASLTGDEDDVWALSEWDGRVYLSNGKDKLWYWDGSGSVLTDVNDVGPDVITVPPARAIVAGFTDRVIIANTIEATGRKAQAVRYTQRNTDNKWSGYGSGYVLLSDDPYPITGMHVVAGRLAIFKGDARGGSIVVGIPTGVGVAPIHFQTVNPGTGIGCASPRTVVPIDASMLAFLGHDEVYVFDGSALKPIGGYVARHIIDSTEPTLLHRAFAYYDRVDNLYVLHVPEDGSTNAATRRYTLNIASGTWTGPDTCALTDAAIFVFQAQQIWDTASGAWEDHSETWDDTLDAPSDPRTAVGRTDGDVWQLDDSVMTDPDGTKIEPSVSTGLLSFEGVEVRSSSRRKMANLLTATHTITYDDVKVLRSVTVVYKDVSSWKPVVRVYVDGVEHEIADGGKTYGSSTGLVKRAVFHCRLTGQTFQTVVEGWAGVQLLDIEYEVDYAGKPQYA